MGSLFGDWPSYNPHNFSQLRPSDPSNPSKMTPATYYPTHDRTLPPPDQVITNEAKNILLRHMYQHSEEKLRQKRAAPEKLSPEPVCKQRRTFRDSCTPSSPLLPAAAPLPLPPFPLSPSVSAPQTLLSPSLLLSPSPSLLPLLVSMAKKGASSSNPSATWNAHNISIFCDVCIKEVEAGHRPGTHFNKEGYANIRVNFKAETRHDYERVQLKNKWDALKNEWKLWKELVGKETSLGWNLSKGTVNASEEWWNNKIQINKKYGRLRKKGISPEMEDKLVMMFSNIVATGDHAWAPSS